MGRVFFILWSLWLASPTAIADMELDKAISDHIDRLLSQEDYVVLAAFTEAQLAVTPQQPTLQRWQAISHYRLGDTKAAIQLLTQSLEQFPNDVDSHYALGVLSVRRAGEVGITHIRKYLRVAESHFQRCIELDADNALARFYLIRIYQNAPELMGDEKDRLPNLQQQLKPLDPTLYHISKVYEQIEHKHVESAQQLLDSLIDPQAHQSNPPPYLSLLAYTQAELSLAQADAERLLSSAQLFMTRNVHWSDMLDVDGYIFIGQAHALTGHKQEAKEAYANAKSLAHNKRLITRIERLERKLQPPKAKK